MARPRVNDSDKRVIQANIRLTKAEHAQVISQSQASGMTPANWIRKVVFTGQFPVAKLSPIDAGLYRELKKIGVNLNQVTHKINQGLFPQEYLKSMLELSVMLKKILSELTNDC